MYESLEAFRADVLASGEAYYSDGSLHDDKLATAYRIYRNAAGGTRLSDLDGNPTEFGVTIVGRLALRASDGAWVPSDEAFPSIDEIMKQNLTTMGEGDDSAGSILDVGNWSLLANDAWLLGGIHALTEFHFASPFRWANLWDAEAGRMTITAREVIGITSSGYEIVEPYPNMEAVATCRDQSRARKFSLVEYRDAVSAHATAETLRELQRTLPGNSRDSA